MFNMLTDVLLLSLHRLTYGPPQGGKKRLRVPALTRRRVAASWRP